MKTIVILLIIFLVGCKSSPQVKTLVVYDTIYIYKSYPTTGMDDSVHQIQGVFYYDSIPCTKNCVELDSTSRIEIDINGKVTIYK